MQVIDIILIGVLVIALAVGLQRGLLASLGSLIGLVAGAFGALWVIPLVNDALPSQAWRGVVVIGGTIFLLVVGAAIGGAVGEALRSGVDRTPLRGFERFLGGVAGVIVAALAASFVGQGLAATGMPVVAQALGSSVVLRTIDDLTPAPVQTTLAQLRSAVLDEGIPRLGILLVPDAVDEPLPAIALDSPDLESAAASVARISGVAYACGTSSTGSGFVAATDLVVTNAHVVAGVETPVVELPGRAAREGRVVYFDAVDDIAVIEVDDLEATSLTVTAPLGTGAAAVVQGYPYGGPFEMGSARVLSVATTPVPDIYQGSSAPRDIYALQATIVPGNSGGPLLSTTGQVVGVVFARADDGRDIGYAMTTTELLPVLAQADALEQPVSTGACTT
ncbi:MarP family serine protease [Microbacterium thalassium]|uniref:S1-C subfamily serine protease n=1 Tax=Microbacterium thalassium TaxID=362649 RepID=A0A7X0KVK5_9MICO|nr:MarP family serine protease [Microbacterium thalassium]MBB6392340.1 S1-C subfamily serine protease [Microbacterium thalassium]GLK23550.1 serine protease [Microbacterium thalassium]